MNKKNKRRMDVLCFSLLVIAGLGLVFWSSSSLADENRGHGRKITGSYRNDCSHYPAEFSGRGKLDYVSEKYVVIDDRQFWLGSGSTFNIPGQFNVVRDLIKVGRYVAYIQNDKGKIISLWRLNSLEDCLGK